MIVATGALASILRAMDVFVDHTGIQDEGIHVLSLIAGTPTNHAAMLEENVISRVLRAIQRHSDNVGLVQRAFATLFAVLRDAKAMKDVPVTVAMPVVSGGAGSAPPAASTTSAVEIVLSAMALYEASTSMQVLWCMRVQCA